jgi:dephospho-CoA kinase
MLSERGALVIDADQISRDLVEPGQPALGEIRVRFGDEIVLPDGRLDRAALAELVFTNPDALADLNAIMHPRIAERTAELLSEAPEDAIVVYDMPLLVENEATTGWEAILVVEARQEVRVQRLLEDRGMTRGQSTARMAAQVTDEARREVADFVIDNSGSLADLRSAVDGVWGHLPDVTGRY